MARAKFDGIIEAVRYLPDGKIASVRAYERRGFIWSDDILLTRADLLTRLEQGKKFVIGQRKTYLGSMFETSQPVHQVQGYIVLESQSAGGDALPGVPVF
jgi:hypothetical protein